MYRRWTDAEKAQLRGAFAEGASTREVAEELGRTVEAVCKMARRMKVSRVVVYRSFSPERRACVLHLLGRGYRLGQIALMTGRRRQTINTMVNLMVRDGLVKRIGTRPNTRYVPCNDRELRTRTHEDRDPCPTW